MKLIKGEIIFRRNWNTPNFKYHKVINVVEDGNCKVEAHYDYGKSEGNWFIPYQALLSFKKLQVYPREDV